MAIPGRSSGQRAGDVGAGDQQAGDVGADDLTAGGGRDQENPRWSSEARRKDRSDRWRGRGDLRQIGCGGDSSKNPSGTGPGTGSGCEGGSFMNSSGTGPGTGL
ncbi:hypothetical protein AMECASPLE_029015 [Ameca splendens]|uniref:Uncharacterized protein n=1 Tax=Ameca splendens TaxID=208324 RepID=A0ABV0YSP3_9TELE